MSLYRGYVPARSCTDGPQEGVRAFARAALAAVPESGSDGIYNCRPIRGSTRITSLHGEGRAFDWRCAAGATWAGAAAEYLRLNSGQFGIQCVIYNRRIWSGAQPDAGWRHYSGVDAHTTHLHIEFSWAAARGLTQDRAASLLAGLLAPPPPKTPVVTAAERVRLVKWQRHLRVKPDGNYGPVTATADMRMRTAAHFPTARVNVREVQRVLGVKQDGDRGPLTDRAQDVWTRGAQALLGVPTDGDWGPTTDHAWWTARWHYTH